MNDPQPANVAKPDTLRTVASLLIVAAIICAVIAAYQASIGWSPAMWAEPRQTALKRVGADPNFIIEDGTDNESVFVTRLMQEIEFGATFTDASGGNSLMEAAAPKGTAERQRRYSRQKLQVIIFGTATVLCLAASFVLFRKNSRRKEAVSETVTPDSTVGC